MLLWLALVCSYRSTWCSLITRISNIKAHVMCVVMKQYILFMIYRQKQRSEDNLGTLCSCDPDFALDFHVKHRWTFKNIYYLTARLSPLLMSSWVRWMAPLKVKYKWMSSRGDLSVTGVNKNTTDLQSFTHCWYLSQQRPARCSTQQNLPRTGRTRPRPHPPSPRRPMRLQSRDEPSAVASCFSLRFSCGAHWQSRDGHIVQLSERPLQSRRCCMESVKGKRASACEGWSKHLRIGEISHSSQSARWVRSSAFSPSWVQGARARCHMLRTHENMFTLRGTARNTLLASTTEGRDVCRGFLGLRVTRDFMDSKASLWDSSGCLLRATTWGVC